MVSCKICNKQFIKNQGLSTHILHMYKKKDSQHMGLTVKDYYDYYVKVDYYEGQCLCCGKNTAFRTLGSGYGKYCSDLHCRIADDKVNEKRINTSLRKYGTTNPMKSDNVKEKLKTTFRQKYGSDWALSSQSVIDKRIETLNTKYGVNNISQLKNVREKKKKTWLKKYGVDHPLKCEKIKKKSFDTCFKNFGVRYPFQSEEVRRKSMDTCIDKYGVPFVAMSDRIKDKMKETNIERYGVPYYSQSEERNERTMSKWYDHLMYDDDKLKGVVEPIVDRSEYVGRSSDVKYKFKCVKCYTVFVSGYYCGIVPRCPTCIPKYTSIIEYQIFEFCKRYTANIIRNDRSVLSGKELDLYFPDEKLAIEIDGLFWHREGKGKNREYHLDKTIRCNDNGIELIHIFEDEWIYKKEILESIIKYKLGKIDKRIHARKCGIEFVDKQTTTNFLNENHIQGNVNGSVSIGLYRDVDLVSIMTFGKPRYNRNYEWELLRFCNKINTSVVGGASKLFKFFINRYNIDSIISYCDNRFSNRTNNLYNSLNFKHLHKSKPNYFYIDLQTCSKRESRIKYQKHKLEKLLKSFDSNLSEIENMRMNNYDRIWDCGNSVYVYER